MMLGKYPSMLNTMPVTFAHYKQALSVQPGKALAESCQNGMYIAEWRTTVRLLRSPVPLPSFATNPFQNSLREGLGTRLRHTWRLPI
jgi:hypothetical protein